MDTINVGITGAFLSLFIQAIKSTGKLPGKWIPLCNIIFAGFIGYALTPDSAMLNFFANWFTIALAAAGTHEMALKKKQVDVTQ